MSEAKYSGRRYSEACFINVVLLSKHSIMKSFKCHNKKNYKSFFLCAINVLCPSASLLCLDTLRLDIQYQEMHEAASSPPGYSYLWLFGKEISSTKFVHTHILHSVN